MKSRIFLALQIPVVAILMLFTTPTLADPPSERGIVMESDVTIAYTWVDLRTGYRVVVGADMDEYCAFIFNFDTLPVTMVDIPTLESRFVVHGGGIVRAEVFNFIEFDCALFTAVGPVAEGMAEFKVVDNDWLGTVETNAANAWGFNVKGTLTDNATGEPRRLIAMQRLMFNDQRGDVQTMIHLK
jgi:hypothetical protein